MIETGYEKVLGIPSMQSILELLSVHGILSIKELMIYTGYSLRTLHNNLKILKDHDIVLQEKRGLYKLSNSRAIQILAKFYEQITIEQVGTMLHKITEKIDQGKSAEELNADLQELEMFYDHWKPIFLKYFPSAMQTILLKIKT
ncbi:MAG: helix-turn-helix domain-containing protein [Candidatus Helarchaeota archaeon]